MSRMISAVLTVSLLLTSTTLTHPALAGGDKKKEVPQRNIETRVYIRKQCILSAPDTNQKESLSDKEFVTALAAIFLPFLIKKALGGASAALKKAGSPETLRDSGRLPTYLYKVSNKVTIGGDGTQTKEKKIFLNPDLGCAIVVRGSFDGADPIQGQLPFEPTAVKFPNGDSGPLTQAGDDQKRIARLRENGIKVNTIDAVFEAAIKVSDDLSAMYYQARFLEVNSFQGFRSSKSGRGLVVSLALNAPASKEGESVIHSH